jgi:hypothetical protein
MTTPQIGTTQEGQLHVPRVKILGRFVEVNTLRVVLTAYIVTRLMVLLIVYVSMITIPSRSGPVLFADPNNVIVDGLIRDDSWWYTSIVNHGYTMGNVETGEQGNAAFFPLYPMLVKMVAALIGNVFVSGLLVSHVAFLVALGYLYSLTRREFDDETAARAVFYLAAAPTSVFFSAMYTESLFVALVIATFYYSRQQQWDLAALCGALAAATRNTGVLLAAVIALEGLHHYGFRIRPDRSSGATLGMYLRRQWQAVRSSWRSLIAAACVPLGLLAFMGYLTNKFGDPIAFITVQATWGRDVSASTTANLFSRSIDRLKIGTNVLGGTINPRALLELLFTIAFGLLLIAVPFKLRPAYAVFGALTFLVPLASGTVASMTRYILMLVPCFILLAYWGRRAWVDRVVVGIFLPLLGYFTVLFSHWYFAG